MSQISAEKEGDVENSAPKPVPSIGKRMGVLALYLGCAPLFLSRHSGTVSAYWKAHRNQALLLWAWLGLFFLLFLALVAIASFLMVENRDWFSSHPVEHWLFSFFRKCLLVWLVFWLYAVWRCLRGCANPVPLLGRLSRQRFFHYTGGFSVFLFFCMLLFLPGAIFSAGAHISEEPREGGVFVLYDDQGHFPRWIFSLAVWRLSLAASQCLKGEKLCLLPADRENMDLALDQGLFVFAGTHGVAEGLLLQDGLYPPNARIRPAGEQLRFVYLAGCDSGAQQKEWASRLAPAQLRTFDRLTPTLEHLWRLWTEMPGTLRSICGK